MLKIHASDSSGVVVERSSTGTFVFSFNGKSAVRAVSPTPTRRFHIGSVQ
jgi:hypothetical protein